MNILKSIFIRINQVARQVWYLPQVVILAIKLRRRQIVPDAFEIERLDRLRNPSKYLGR